MINRIRNEIIWLKKYIKIFKQGVLSKGEKCFLLGVPEHGNLGDHAIVLGEYKFLKKINYNKKIIEIPVWYARKHTQMFKPIIGKSDVLIQGGGFLGSLWPEEDEMSLKAVKNFKNSKIVLFPQTIYFYDNEEGKKQKELAKNVYKNHKNLHLFFRETKSYNLAKNDMKLDNVFLVPDMVLALEQYKSDVNRERKGILFCLRSDKEKTLIDIQEKQLVDNVNKYYKGEQITYTDTVIEKNIWKNERKREVYKKIDEFYNTRLVVTDRLHGMVFAALAGTPCIVMGNCNYKVKGIYNWIKNNDYIEFIEDFDSLEEIVDKMSKLKADQKFDKTLIKVKFDDLRKCLLS